MNAGIERGGHAMHAMTAILSIGAICAAITMVITALANV